MANEAVKVEATEQPGNIRSYTVANSPAIPIHTLMYLSGDNTASFGATAFAIGAVPPFAGIAIAAKEAADGCTVLALDTGGVWDLTASGVIPLGSKVLLAGANKVMVAEGGTAALSASGGLFCGTALEAAIDAEVIRVDVSRS